MDLPVYLRVLWRFRFLVAAGVVLACALSLLSIVRVNPTGSPKLKYRKAPVYVSYSQLFVTQPGFPWGSLRPPASADAGRFTSLAILYSQLATSDAVRQIMLKDGPINGTIQVAPVLDAVNQEPLPLVSIAGFAKSPALAIQLARRETSALLSYIQTQQSSSKISDRDRVLVTLAKQANEAKVFQARKMTVAIVVFLGVLLATCGLAFLLQNLRPQAVAEEEAARLRSVASDAA